MASTNAGSARASLMWLLSMEGVTAPAARGQSTGGDKQCAQGERKTREKGRDKSPSVSAVVLMAKEAGRDKGGQSAARRGDELSNKGGQSAARQQVEAAKTKSRSAAHQRVL